MPMARQLGQLGLLLAALVGPAHAWAAPPSVPSGAAAVAASLVRIDHRVAQHQAEVQRLQRDIARQQSRSRQASQRLREQDRQIAELQRQLQTLHGGTPVPRGAKPPQQ